MDDKWLAIDKALHLCVAFAVTVIAVVMGRAAGMPLSWALPTAAGLAVTLGVLKEVYDGCWSWKDLAVDAVGIAVALIAAVIGRW